MMKSISEISDYIYNYFKMINIGLLRRSNMFHYINKPENMNMVIFKVFCCCIHGL